MICAHHMHLKREHVPFTVNTCAPLPPPLLACGAAYFPFHCTYSAAEDHCTVADWVGQGACALQLWLVHNIAYAAGQDRSVPNHQKAGLMHAVKTLLYQAVAS